MGTIVDLVAKISAQVSGFQSSMKGAADSTDRLANSWTTAGGKVARAGADIASTTARIATGIGALAGGTTAYLAKLGVSFNATKQEAITSFSVMLHSAEAAKQLYGEMASLAQKTPLETKDIAAAGQTLLQFGMEATGLIPLLKQMGDAAGGNSEKFRAMALAYGQANAAGRLMGNDNLQFINAGFNPLMEISRTTGVSVEKLRKQMEDGEISIQMIAEAFRTATSEGGLFFNRMEESSKDTKGLLSSLRDNIEAALGGMFEPLSKAIDTGFSKALVLMNDPRFVQWSEKLKAGVASFVDELDKFGQSNGTSMIVAFGNAILWAANGVVDLTRTVRQAWPFILSTAASLGAWLRPLTDIIVKNPQLIVGVVALATAFKTLELIGIVQWFSRVGVMMGQVISLFVQLPSVISAARGPVMAFFATPVGAGLVVGLTAVATAFALVSQNIQETLDKAADAERRISKLAADTEKIKGGQRNQELAGLDSISDPHLKAVAIQNALAEAKRKANEASNQAVRSQTALSDHDVGKDVKTLDDWGQRHIVQNIPMLGGDMDRPGLQAKAEQDKAAAESAAAHEQALMQKLATLRESEVKDAKDAGVAMGNAAADVLNHAAPGIGHEIGGTGTGGAAGSNKRIDAAFAQHRNDAMNSKYHGYDRVRDFLGFNPTADQVSQYGMSVKGSTPGLSAELADKYGKSDKSAESLDKITEEFMKQIHEMDELEKRVNSANDRLEAFSEKMHDLRDIVPAQELTAFNDRFQDLRQQFIQGKITSDQYRDSLKNLDARMQDAQHAAQSQKGLTDAATSVRRKLVDLKGDGKHGEQGSDFVRQPIRDKADKSLQSIEQQGAKLAQAFQQGTLSAAKYEAELKRLKDATEDVEKAAEKEEMLERRKALLAGDWKGAGLNPEKDAQKRMEDMQVQYAQDFYNNMIDYAVSGISPLSDAVSSAVGYFSDLGTQVTQFGSNLVKGFGGGSGGGGMDIGGAWQAFTNFANSISGQIDEMFNERSMLQQALQVVKDPQRIAQLTSGIQWLTDSINNLSKAIVPTFNGYRSYDPIFRDPGLSVSRNSSGTSTATHATVNINIPNASILTQEFVDQFVQRTQDAITRQGTNAFRTT